MTKSELKLKIMALLLAGTGRSETFDLVSSQGVNDRTVATLIASYAMPLLCRQHQGKVRMAIVLMVVQSLMTMVIGLVVVTDSAVFSYVLLSITGLVAMVPLLFAWGIHKNRVSAYNAFLVLACVQAPRALDDFMSSPVGSSLALAITAGLIGFIAYVRYKIFPDMVVLGPRKLKGHYQFST